MHNDFAPLFKVTRLQLSSHHALSKPMHTSIIERTNLWSKAFVAVGNGNENFQDRFANAFTRFRERVGALLTFIPSDMKQYTVHDLSHLDALWEMADLIAGTEFVINPAEAFVFGGAVLLHDAGMSVAAYPGGEKDITQLPHWEDSLAWACSVVGVVSPDEDGFTRARALAVTDVLRRNHAKKAEELATQKWTNPNDGAEEYLLEDSDLRAHYGATIGRIANSHHWSIRRVLTDLQPTLGAFGATPHEWSVDCVKIALLLRCADAAHLDHRRAPRFLHTLTRPAGISKLHWNFQSKIAKPQVRDGRQLLYTSRSAFSFDEVESWHLCWDMLKMVNQELSDSFDALGDRKKGTFAVTGVVGTKSADTLAQYVEVVGWRPIANQLQVSDVPHLARTLGGRDLYSSAIAPLRELLQNAADAVDARAAIDDDFDARNGRITIKVLPEVNGDYTVSVEDDGLGMSENTLTGALIDFGTSFWKSEAARVEFPGLKARFEARGRYGIGFFSIFMWADVVKVCSRKFSEGLADARVLEFPSGLGGRPILRPAAPGEASTRFSTKITSRISADRWNTLFVRPEKEIESQKRQYGKRYGYGYGYGFAERPNKESTLARLVGMLEIPVTLDDGNTSRVVNLPNWADADNDQFASYLERIWEMDFPNQLRKFVKAETLVHKDGKVVGRAFLKPNIAGNTEFGMAYYDKGIFVEVRQSQTGPCGIAIGKALNAARDRGEHADILNDSAWLDQQVDYMTRLSEHIGERLACQEGLVANNQIGTKLPIVLLDRKDYSLDQLPSAISKRQKIHFFLKGEANGEEKFSASAVDNVSAFIGKNVDENQLYFLIDFKEKVDRLSLSQLITAGASPLAKVLNVIQRAFGENPKIRTSIVQGDTYSRLKYLYVEMQRSDPPIE